MYINPFLAGVLTLLLVELAAILTYAIIANEREKK